MKKDFNVGDVVVIRDWDDMEEEFGLDSGGDIPCRCDFISLMKETCGLKAKITEINGDFVKLDFINVDENVDTSWTYSLDMIRHMTEEDECDKDGRKIKIFESSDGKKVIAVDSETMFEAFATCSPEDKFDFITGAKIAFERLMDKIDSKTIKVGDHVKVTNNGRMYTLHTEWAKKHLTYDLSAEDERLIYNWDYSHDLKNGTVARVILIDDTEDKYYIFDDSSRRGYIIDSQGIQKV